MYALSRVLKVEDIKNETSQGLSIYSANLWKGENVMNTLYKKFRTFIEDIQNSVKILSYILWDLNKKLFSDILQVINDLDINFQAKKFVLTIVFAYVFYNLFNIKALASPMLIFRIMLWIYDNKRR